MSVTDDRQTDGRQQIANMNVSSRSLKTVTILQQTRTTVVITKKTQFLLVCRIMCSKFTIRVHTFTWQHDHFELLLKTFLFTSVFSKAYLLVSSTSKALMFFCKQYTDQFLATLTSVQLQNQSSTDSDLKSRGIYSWNYRYQLNTAMHLQ